MNKKHTHDIIYIYTHTSLLFSVAIVHISLQFPGLFMLRIIPHFQHGHFNMNFIQTFITATNTWWLRSLPAHSQITYLSVIKVKRILI